MAINFNSFKICLYRTKKPILKESSFKEMIKDYFPCSIKKYGYCNRIYNNDITLNTKAIAFITGIVISAKYSKIKHWNLEELNIIYNKNILFVIISAYR